MKAYKKYFFSSHFFTSRVSDPDGIDPDLDLTLEKRPDPPDQDPDPSKYGAGSDIVLIMRICITI